MQVYTFKSPEDMFEAMFGPRDHNSHVNRFRFIQQEFGGNAGWVSFKARRAAEREASRVHLCKTEEGRAWVAKMDKKHDDWRRGL